MKPATRRHFSMLRSFALADWITLANAASGTAAIFACMAYLAGGDRAYVWITFALLPIALVCDFLDGTVARWRRKHSALGADLDSLADVVSFGVAPAALGFALGMDGGFDVICLTYFVGCGISRLARYNVTAASMSDDRGKVKYYQGTPIPTSLAIVAVLAAAFATDRVGNALWFGVIDLGWELHPLVLIYVLSGSAMISATLKIPKP